MLDQRWITLGLAELLVISYVVWFLVEGVYSLLPSQSTRPRLQHGELPCIVHFIVTSRAKCAYCSQCPNILPDIDFSRERERSTKPKDTDNRGLGY